MSDDSDKERELEARAEAMFLDLCNAFNGKARGMPIGILIDVLASFAGGAIVHLYDHCSTDMDEEILDAIGEDFIDAFADCVSEYVADRTAEMDGGNGWR